MKAIMKVTGMMCQGCENRVNTALGKLDGIRSCIASAKDGTVVCEYDETKIALHIIHEMMEDIGYEVTAG